MDIGRMSKEERMLEELRDKLDSLTQEEGCTVQDIKSLIAKLVYTNNFCYDCRIHIWDMEDEYIKLVSKEENKED